MISALKRIKHKLERALKFYRRIGLKNRTFSIISNNCVGGYIYQYFGLKYRTPTAGVLFHAADYVKLCREPKKYFSADPVIIDIDDSERFRGMEKDGKPVRYIIGRIDDIEVCYVHYPTVGEAVSKWKRRCSRFNYDNIVLFFAENETTTEKEIRDFLAIPDCTKVCFTYNKYDIEGTVFSQEVADLPDHPWRPEIVCNLIDWKKFLNRNEKRSEKK